ncbi:hypothetical protein [Lihuaxuella thermophila]|uniref:Uncharacterized protein n=1 Tax=Lihuaxuella thermophila TaxID=1173111 RepID=A0A1H8C785_9BACL|nr:hypothetical protein [Lihuaxuella thermophila]SEM90900.1 hypothetical protein SAMN05444955_103115 [Lihuaxuella thermophila]
MNVKAAVFACHVTGLVGLAASLFLWKTVGSIGLLAGLIGSGFWFGLGWYFRRQLKP